MAELTHDGAEDGFHEIQLSGKQLVFLFMSASVVLVVTFICGVLVGRNVRAVGTEPTDTVAASVPATGTEAPVTTQPTEPPTPPVEDELSYHQRLEGAAKPEALKPQPKEPEPAPAPAAKPEPPPASNTAKPEPPAASARETEKPAGASVPTSGRRGRWVVQVTALSNRANAAERVQRLIAAGYPAFLLDPPAGTPRLYRIQIGRYDDRAEADRIAKRLRSEGYKPEVKR